jgi:hypothetical protein
MHWKCQRARVGLIYRLRLGVIVKQQLLNSSSCDSTYNHGLGTKIDQLGPIIEIKIVLLNFFYKETIQYEVLSCINLQIRHLIVNSC